MLLNWHNYSLAYCLLRYWEAGPHNCFGGLLSSYNNHRAWLHGIPSIFD